MTTNAAIDLYGIRARRFNVSEYYKLAEIGILAPDERVELLDGEILAMSPMGSRHARYLTRLLNLLARRLGDRAVVACQVPIHLDDFSEPEPDLVLFDPSTELWQGGHPGARDTLLVIEVSDTSLAFDRGVKTPLYAAAGVTELWIVDLAADRLHVHRRPSGRTYTEVVTLEGGDTVSPEAFPNLVLDISELIDV